MPGAVTDEQNSNLHGRIIIGRPGHTCDFPGSNAGLEEFSHMTTKRIASVTAVSILLCTPALESEFTIEQPETFQV